MQNPFSNKKIKNILQKKNSEEYLIKRESSVLEYKQAFNIADIAAYLRDFAAFANNNGGYLVFGVKDSPHIPIGIKKSKFQNVDEQQITGFINKHFAPTIEWEKDVVELEGKSFGMLYIYKSLDKPIVAMKDGGRGQEVKNGEIYYRYIGRSEKIRYPELKQILDDKLNQERRSWQEHIERIVRIGPRHAAILDTMEGKIEGDGGTILIDDNLIPKLKFIKKGEFVEKSGKPTLKLVGDLKPASVVEKIRHDDPYVFRPTQVSEIVEKAIGKKFRAQPEHIRCWKHYKIRMTAGNGRILCNKDYCDYKEALNYVLYNQKWVDFLIKEMSSKNKYRKIALGKSNGKN